MKWLLLQKVRELRCLKHCYCNVGYGVLYCSKCEKIAVKTSGRP